MPNKILKLNICPSQQNKPVRSVLFVFVPPQMKAGILLDEFSWNLMLSSFDKTACMYCALFQYDKNNGKQTNKQTN